MMPSIPIPAPAPHRWKRPGIRPRRGPRDNRRLRRDKADLTFSYHFKKEMASSKKWFPMLWKPLKMEDLRYDQMAEGWAKAFAKWNCEPSKDPLPCVQV